VRGGSWNNQAGNCRAAIRNDRHPGNDWNNQGFRLAAAHPLGSSLAADPVFGVPSPGAAEASEPPGTGRDASRHLPNVSGGSFQLGLPMNKPGMPAVMGMLPAFCPVWAEVFGEDEAGVFAEFTLQGVRFVWRWIPPGRFKMGSPEDEAGRYGDEGPQHEVTISQGFWLGETPVTQAQWEALRPENPSRFKGEDRPVEQVTFPMCQAFATDLNAAVPGLAAGLPSEAQWEYACRAGTSGAFQDGSPCTLPDGDDPALNRLGWFDKNSGGHTQPVKWKESNAWGLYDLHGNVWEWCRDRWESNAYASRAGGVVDPVLESDDPGAARVVRGGSWGLQAGYCRAAIRCDWHPGLDWLFLGFRLAAGHESQAAEPQGAERLPPPPERRSRG
jgi:formylglycine-generating enzyme required for sulfatase activity